MPALAAAVVPLLIATLLGARSSELVSTIMVINDELARLTLFESMKALDGKIV